MLDTDAVITSADPQAGSPIAVAVTTRPGLVATILDRTQAVALGRDIFGSLLAFPAVSSISPRGEG